MTAVVLQIHAGDNCRQSVITYITHDDRPNISSVKPARSDATWRLVAFKLKDSVKPVDTRCDYDSRSVDRM